jgi:glycosyltransferase involved in cell wall biosynthesis
VSWVLRRADVIVALSSESAEAVRGMGLKARIIPNAVSGPPTGIKRNLAVFGGAVTRRKGVDVLVDAWRALGDQTRDWELVIAGPIAEPGLVADLPPRSSAVGSLARSDLLRLVADARIAVLPSRDEAMPLFILEAMAGSAAVVATPVGGVPSVIASGDTGMLVSVGDTQSLQRALAELIGSPRFADAIASRGHGAWQERYSPEVVVGNLEEAWNEAFTLAAAR